MGAFLIAIVAAFFVGGLPGVLFARLFAWFGLRREPAILLGSMVIPAALWLALIGWRMASKSEAPWVAPVAAFAGGVAASLLYFRTRK